MLSADMEDDRQNRNVEPVVACPTYPPVPIDVQHAIRILSLSAGHGDEVIVCHLSPRRLHINRDLKTQACRGRVALDTYEALSYTWGPMQKHGIILLNSVEWPVMKNLLAALKRLRHRSKPRKLWIDQLCIDQSNNDERGQQVKLMAKIYSLAEDVLVWLGDGPDDNYKNHEHDQCCWKLSPNLKDWTMDHGSHCYIGRKSEWQSSYLSELLHRH